MPALHHTPIEILEHRIAPAGLVSATFDTATGVLTLNGDINDNVVHVFQTGNNTYRIEGDATTEIGTAGNFFADVAGKLSGVVINAGPGSDTFKLTNLQTLKELTFNGDTGSDALNALNLKTKGNVTVNLGADGGGASFNGVTSIGGGLTVNYGDDGGVAAIIGTSGTVKGSVTLNGGAGADSFELAADTGVLNKGVKFTGGAGTNQLTIQGVSATLGKGAAGNAVEFSGGTGASGLDVRGATVNLKGNVLFTGGTGAETAIFSSATLKLGGGLTVTGSDGTDVVQVLAGTASIKGAVNLDLGEGAGNLTEFRPGVSLTLGKTLTVKGGALDDAFLISGGPTVSIKGAVSVDVGDGAGAAGNTVSLSSTTLTLGNSVTIKGAPASSLAVSSDATVFSVKGLLSVETGDGDSLVQLFAKETTLGALTVKTAGGSDLVGVIGSKLKIKGATTVETGAAVDFVDFGFDTTEIKGGVAIRTGADSDGVSFFTDGTVKGDFEIDLGAGNDGSSNADVASNSGIAGGLKLSGKLTISSATTDTGMLGNTETISIRDVTVSKAILVNLGVVNSTVTIDNLIAKDLFTLNTGAGIDEVNIEQAALFGASSFSKVVAIDLGAGNDIFRAGISSADGSSSFARFLDDVTVDGGADTDASNDFLNVTTNFFDAGVTTNRNNFEGAFI